jgi:hypothetical protein
MSDGELAFLSQGGTPHQRCGLRQLFDDLAAAERGHEAKAESLIATHVTPTVREKEDETQRGLFVGLAASLGAAISMAFAEAATDYGSLTGRGSPIMRGAVVSSMTTLGGLGHTLPFLISQFQLAFVIAMAVVAVELVRLQRRALLRSG